MAAQKPIGVDTTGALVEMTPATTSAGVSDAGKLIGLGPDGFIDPTLLANDNSITVTASEALAAGALFNLHLNNNAPAVRNADAGSGKTADGFVPGAIASGSSGLGIMREGLNSSLSGLTPGATYFLGASGAVTTTVPTASGAYLQPVGKARSATELSFIAGTPVKRA